VPIIRETIFMVRQLDQILKIDRNQSGQVIFGSTFIQAKDLQLIYYLWDSPSLQNPYEIIMPDHLRAASSIHVLSIIPLLRF
jgi:hypothetical protein